MEDPSDTDYDTEGVGRPPYGLRARRCHGRNLGGGTGTRRGTPMTIKAGGGNSKGKGGRRKNIKYKTEWEIQGHIFQ